MSLHRTSALWPWTRPCSPPGLPTRSFGYDMRPAPPSTGELESGLNTSPCCPHRPEGLSDAAYGHGGWTGQSLWIDPQRNVYLIILTNRTHCLDFEANTYSNPRFRQQVGEILLRHWTHK